jgi:ADP-ribose pyrophosphatase YjhB (NUDIX family)
MDSLMRWKREALRLWGRVPRSRLRHAVEWSYTPKFLVDGVGVAVDEARRVLLVHHTYKPRPWGFPGGGMGYGETVEAAVQRELLEEAGAEVTVLDCILAQTDVERRLVKLYFRCAARSQRFVPSAEIDEARWFDAADLPRGADPMVPLVLERLFQMEARR